MKYQYAVALAACFLGAAGCGSKSAAGGTGGLGGAGAQGGNGGAYLVPDSCAPDCGPTAEQLFDNSKIADIRITFDPKVIAAEVAALQAAGYQGPLETWVDLMWAKWKHCGPYDNYVPVTMEYRSPDGVGNVTMHNVGMRFRGTKSRGVNDLDGFKLDFQKLYKGEMLDKKPKFGGRSQLNILSIENHDMSLIGQCLAYKTMREYGDVPAPLCNHLRIYVNDALYGITQNVEAVDEKPFLTRNFQDNNDGSFYGASAACGYPDSKADLKYLGDTFTGDYLMEYEPIQAKDVTTPETDLLPMLKCADATATPDSAAFKACISEWLDVPEWLKLIAAESLMPTLESFTGTLRNYFLYFKADPTSVHQGRFVIYSWDYDTAFQHSGCYPTSCDPLVSVASWFGPARGRAALVKRLTTEFRTEYCAAMNAFLKNTYKPSLVDDLSTVLAPAIAASQFTLSKGQPFSVTDWQTQTMDLRNFIATHGPAAQAQVDAICTPPGGTQ